MQTVDGFDFHSSYFFAIESIYCVRWAWLHVGDVQSHDLELSFQTKVAGQGMLKRSPLEQLVYELHPSQEW